MEEKIKNLSNQELLSLNSLLLEYKEYLDLETKKMEEEENLKEKEK